MGLKLWLAKKLLNSDAIKLKSTNQGLLVELNEQLKETASDYRAALKEAEATSRIIETRRRIKDLRNSLRDTAQQLNDEDGEDEDGEDEDGEDEDVEQPIGDKLISELVNKFIGAQPSANSPIQTNLPLSDTPLKAAAIEKVNNLTDAELLKLQKMGLI